MLQISNTEVNKNFWFLSETKLNWAVVFQVIMQYISNRGPSKNNWSLPLTTQKYLPHPAPGEKFG